MLNLAAFRVRFPAFSETGDTTVQAALDQAALRTDTVVFDTLTDDAHGYLTAHLLSAAPDGQPARLKGEGFQTLYLEERQRLEDLVACGWVP